jgi:hypothetical protein
MDRSVNGRSGGEDEATSLILPIVHIVPDAANGKFFLNEGFFSAPSSGSLTNWFG